MNKTRNVADEIEVMRRAELRWDQLFTQLAASPLVEVVGIVGPTGVGGWGNSDHSSTLHFAFDAWRVAGAELQNRELTICRKIAYDEFDGYRKFIRDAATLRIRARVLMDTVFGNPHALLDSVVGPDDSDSELNEHAQKLRQPITFEDPKFGMFTLDRSVNWFATETAWLGQPVSLQLVARNAIEAQAAAKVAFELWESQESWNQRNRNTAVRELLPLKNGTWLEDGKPRLTTEEFKQRMVLESITINPDGSFAFWHRDGDMFWEHAIEITGNLTDGPTGASIQG
jgi:hypothetical protein